MLFTLAIIIGLISLALFFLSPVAAVIGLIFSAALVITNSQRNRRQQDERRHQETLEAIRTNKK